LKFRAKLKVSKILSELPKIQNPTEWRV